MYIVYKHLNILRRRLNEQKQTHTKIKRKKEGRHIEKEKKDPF